MRVQAVVEVELARVSKLHDRDRCEQFRNGANRVEGVCVGGFVGRRIRHAHST
jgi:hypothetical protein